MMVCGQCWLTLIVPYDTSTALTPRPLRDFSQSYVCTNRATRARERRTGLPVYDGIAEFPVELCS